METATFPLSTDRPAPEATAPSADRRPRIVHVITGLGRGGAEKTLANLVLGSRRYRHEVVSLTDGGVWGERLGQAGVPFHVLGLTSAAVLPRVVMRLHALLRATRPSLIQTWLYHADFIGTLAAKLTGLPIVWSLRCSDMDSGRYGLLTRCLMVMSGVPVVVLANSQAGRSWHAGRGYRPRRWEVIPNGVDTDSFRPDAAARQAWRTRLAVAPDTALIGMAARRDPMKDQETFLRCARIIAGACSRVTFCMAGGGTATDPVLRSMAAEVAAPVHFVGECEDMPGLLAALDVLVMPSRFGEGFPNVVAEAMSCGTLCVVTNVGGAADIVGEEGFVVPAGDTEGLAGAILKMAEDEGLRAGLKEPARRRIVELYSLPLMISRYEDLYARLMAPAGPLGAGR